MLGLGMGHCTRGVAASARLATTPTVAYPRSEALGDPR